jgi:hypothetical protein
MLATVLDNSLVWTNFFWQFGCLHYCAIYIVNRWKQNARLLPCL